MEILKRSTNQNLTNSFKHFTRNAMLMGVRPLRTAGIPLAGGFGRWVLPWLYFIDKPCPCVQITAQD